jgi:hypothetical protein
MAVTWKEVAFAADVATISSSTPQAVGTAAAAGSGSDASADDHVHDIGVGAIDAANLIANDVIDSEHYTDASIDTQHIAADQIDATLIADDAVGSEHIEDLSAALNFNGQEAQHIVIHTNSGTVAPAVIGKTYYDTAGSALYVCVDNT